MSLPTTYTPPPSEQDPVFWLARVPVTLKKRAETRRKKLGQTKKEAMRAMIMLYLTDIYNPVKDETNE